MTRARGYCLPAVCVADTIMRTIELCVTITDGIDEKVTTVFCAS